MERLNTEMADTKPLTTLDFNNTEIAFSYKSDAELKEMKHLFQMMNSRALVSAGTRLLPLAMKLHIPFTKAILRKTIFKHFVGGETILDTQKTIDLLHKYKTLTVLDFGVEAKSSDKDHDRVKNESIKAIELAASNDSVPVISTKFTGLADNALLEKIQSGSALTAKEVQGKKKLERRVDEICKRGYELNVGVMVDAEESWVQDTIDHLVDDLMAEYNKDQVIVYNTFQLYRNDKLDFLKDSLEKARSGGYKLGAKLVRGAYMEKEREYRAERGLSDIIHKTKKDTDTDFDRSILFCVDNYKEVSCVCSTHNIESNAYMAKLIDERGLDKRHPHLNFCQLLGMSDYITFNLAMAGYNVAKYLPYGPIKDVVPYLMRRAEENTSVSDGVSRELSFIIKEMQRRGIA